MGAFGAIGSEAHLLQNLVNSLTELSVALGDAAVQNGHNSRVPPSLERPLCTARKSLKLSFPCAQNDSLSRLRQLVAKR